MHKTRLLQITLILVLKSQHTLEMELKCSVLEGHVPGIQ